MMQAVQAVNAYYDGRAFVPEIPINAAVRQEAIIIIMKSDPPLDAESMYDDLNYYDPAAPEDPPEVWKARSDNLLKLVGSIPHDEISQMEKSIMECREIDENEW
jgi:hypothetical protein